MRELVMYRTMASVDKRRQEEPERDKQLDFWLGEAIFWIIRLQICDEEENYREYDETLHKAWECLGHLHSLFG